MIVSNMNTLLVTLVTELEKQEANMNQYNRRNNVAISGISNEVSDENLEGKAIDICKEEGIDLKPYDIEGYHKLSIEDVLAPSNSGIVKFVNRKNSEDMFDSEDSFVLTLVLCHHFIQCGRYRYIINYSLITLQLFIIVLHQFLYINYH